MKIFKLTFVLSVLMICTNLEAQQTAPKGTPPATKKAAKVTKDKSGKKTSVVESVITNLSISAGIGTSNYFGDLMKYNVLYRQTSFSASAGLVYELMPQLNARVDFGYQKLKGADNKKGGAHQNRNLSFENNVFDMSAALEFSFFNPNKFMFTPYLSGGIGILFHNPSAKDVTGKKTLLRPLGTEGQLLGGGLPQPYRRYAYEFPLGLGVKYALNKRWMLQLEYNFRITGTDYLDDVSRSEYVAKPLLDSKNPLTAKFTYRGNEVGNEPYPSNLRLPRGNPNNKDSYYTTQLKVVYAVKTKAETSKSDVSMPTLPEPPKDRDGDGVLDVFDRCPDVAGLVYLQGCPDKDGDGIADMDDKCPDVAGFTRYQGCPIPDSDADGIDDEADKCPTAAGVARYQGCPVPDTDGDGVNDDEDKCVTEKGLTTNFGCPVISQETINRVNLAAKKIFFKTYSADLLAKSFTSLDEIYKVLEENPGYKIQINGHTDNTGETLMNQNLSSARAAAVRDYLKNKGIDESRLFSTGYGELRPIASNNTVSGRAENRRVEMVLRNY